MANYSQLVPNKNLPTSTATDVDEANMQEEIKIAMIILSKIITKHGKAYLPIYMKLEEELEAQKSKKLALERAIKFSSSTMGKE